MAAPLAASTLGRSRNPTLDMAGRGFGRPARARPQPRTRRLGARGEDRGGAMPTLGVERTAAFTRRAALAALVVSVTLGASACDPPECVQPYVPVAERVVVPGVPPPADWPATGEVQTIDVGFDTDGDGTQDTVEPGVGTRADQVTVHRASGDLVLTGRPQISVGGEPGSARLVAPASFGDIDG